MEKEINSGNQVDKDILQCKADILRAYNSVFSSESEKPEQNAVPEPVEKPEESQAEFEAETDDANETKVWPVVSEGGNPVTIRSESESEVEVIAKEPVLQESEKVEASAESEEAAEIESQQEPVQQIPKLNLAEEIMAENRKAAAAKRQRPQARNTINTPPVSGTVGEVISEVKKQTAAAVAKAEAPIETVNNEKVRTRRFSMAHGRFTNFGKSQSQIVRDIVNRDIARFYPAAGKNTLQGNKFSRVMS